MKRMRESIGIGSRFARWISSGKRDNQARKAQSLATFSIPVLCYHSSTHRGDTYETNDHIALESDLKELGRRGYQIVPIPTLVALLCGELQAHHFTDKRLVGLTFDDARDFDYYDTESQTGRPVPSFHRILRESQGWCQQICNGPRAVSFVIASPEARSILGQRRTDGKEIGKGFNDSWWLDCAAGGIIGIANHGWDHVHNELPTVRQRENKRGSFFEITTFDDAESQIADAQRYILHKTDGNALPLFAYPYGHVASYLSEEYFPSASERLGIHAAFSTAGASARPDANIWSIPRFVCGWHWKGVSGFSDLLDSIEIGSR